MLPRHRSRPHACSPTTARGSAHEALAQSTACGVSRVRRGRLPGRTGHARRRAGQCGSGIARPGWRLWAYRRRILQPLRCGARCARTRAAQRIHRAFPQRPPGKSARSWPAVRRRGQRGRACGARNLASFRAGSGSGASHPGSTAALRCDRLERAQIQNIRGERLRIDRIRAPLPGQTTCGGAGGRCSSGSFVAARQHLGASDSDCRRGQVARRGVAAHARGPSRPRVRLRTLAR